MTRLRRAFVAVVPTPAVLDALEPHVTALTATEPAIVLRRLGILAAAKIAITYADIASLAFTGRDPAAGKSWEAWVKKYMERKAAGETQIALEPDPVE